MWSYYGSKSKVIHHYPPPKENKIIEPFAGSARYALRYWDRDVLLTDTYEVVVKLWKYLQQCSKKDILSLPDLKYGDTINKDDFDCIEQSWLMGYLSRQGDVYPALRVSPFGQHGMNSKKKRVAGNLHKIKHWEIKQLNYEDLENQTATWFIDPPYQFGGYKYVGSMPDFDKLSKWCMSRQGHVIVCENTKADWMDFKPMISMKGTRFKSVEAIWSNHPTAFDNEQLDIFSNGE